MSLCWVVSRCSSGSSCCETLIWHKSVSWFPRSLHSPRTLKHIGNKHSQRRALWNEKGNSVNYTFWQKLFVAVLFWHHRLVRQLQTNETTDKMCCWSDLFEAHVCFAAHVLLVSLFPPHFVKPGFSHLVKKQNNTNLLYLQLFSPITLPPHDALWLLHLWNSSRSTDKS